MANGQVYVFNSYNEVLSVSINGSPVTTIGGWAPAGGTVTKYTPTGKGFGIVKHLDDHFGEAVFGYNAPNTLILTWEDGGEATVNINMPGPGDNISITNDIVVYITHNQAVLMNTNGFVISSSKVTLRNQG